jgi:hypothetical protein
MDLMTDELKLQIAYAMGVYILREEQKVNFLDEYVLCLKDFTTNVYDNEYDNSITELVQKDICYVNAIQCIRINTAYRVFKVFKTDKTKKIWQDIQERTEKQAIEAVKAYEYELMKQQNPQNLANQYVYSQPVNNINDHADPNINLDIDIDYNDDDDDNDDDDKCGDNDIGTDISDESIEMGTDTDDDIESEVSDNYSDIDTVELNLDENSNDNYKINYDAPDLKREYRKFHKSHKIIMKRLDEKYEKTVKEVEKLNKQRLRKEAQVKKKEEKEQKRKDRELALTLQKAKAQIKDQMKKSDPESYKQYTAAELDNLISLFLGDVLKGNVISEEEMVADLEARKETMDGILDKLIDDPEDEKYYVNDIYEMFFEDCTRRSSKSIDLDVLRHRFNKWHSRVYETDEDVSKHEFNKDIKSYKKVEKLMFHGRKVNGIRNLKIINDPDETDTDGEDDITNIVDKKDVVSI